jgi:hypothetical protein
MFLCLNGVAFRAVSSFAAVVAVIEHPALDGFNFCIPLILVPVFFLKPAFIRPDGFGLFSLWSCFLKVSTNSSFYSFWVFPTSTNRSESVISSSLKANGFSLKVR